MRLEYDWKQYVEFNHVPGGKDFDDVFVNRTEFQSYNTKIVISAYEIRLKLVGVHFFLHFCLVFWKSVNLFKMSLTLLFNDTRYIYCYRV